MKRITAQTLIEALQLEPHPEGGFFRRTYESSIDAAVGPHNEDRKLLTCIHYLLTRDSPIGRLHVNHSDIVHFFQRGEPITYTLVSPEYEISRVTLGPDLNQGHRLQIVVPGGWWKASKLDSGEYGLISEAVSPGFAHEDMRFIDATEIQARCPELIESLSDLCRP